MTGFGFSGHKKLKKTDDFSSVFNFRRRFSGDFLVWHYRPNALQDARIGLVVSKKVARHAVKRNYARRVLRELFRHQQRRITGYDLVIRVQKPFGKAEFGAIQVEFNRLLEKMPNLVPQNP